jgi:hypothetical protein
LVLVSVERLSAAEMDELRRTIIDQDERAYRHVPDTYGATAPITAD